ncbi:MAG: hypothetical protein ACYTEX_25495 [Planctomycetota bacterium]|jgi:hypothetical protein
MKRKLTSTQIGAVAENLVANQLMIESGGRLASFIPMADDAGIDRLVYDKTTGKSIPIQIKSRSSTLNKPGKSEKGHIVHFEIRSAALRNKEHAYLLAVLLSQDLQSTERAWLLPMKDIPGLFNRRTTQSKYIMRANRSLTSGDKFSSYRCKDMTAVSKRIIELFDE